MKKILLLLATLLCLSLVACGNPKTTNSADGYIGTNYETVVSELKEAGFTNIETIEVQDLTSSSNLQDGDVGEISINGETNFGENSSFEADAPIIITYHTIPKIESPIASAEIQTYDSDSLVTMFKDAGFTNVTTEDVYDLDPDEYDVEYKNELRVGNISSFEKGEGLPFDAEIKIICHRPYEKYDVTLLIDFIPNILFNKYDVVVELNGEETVLPHGEDAKIKYRLKEDVYTLSFISDEDSSVISEVEIDVHCDVEASYKITCWGEEIEVEIIYIDNKEDLADDEVKVMSSEDDLKYKYHTRIVNELKSWGFTNVCEVTSYDYSFFAPYSDEDVISVTINGSNSYKKGDVFKKDAEVIVTYYESLGDNSSEDSSSEQHGDTNVFYSTNDYETAKEGNSGVFSYKSKGGSYDVYWIIDFDEGYVYWFTDGNGESTCDKVKIVSGTLNDKIKVTWHDGGDEWSWHLHFKYVNHPETLIVNDHLGIATEFGTIDLDDALEIRDTKNIKEY